MIHSHCPPASRSATIARPPAAGAALLLALLVGTSAQASTKTTLYNFTGGLDGDGPTTLIAGPGGVYYGTALYGGLVNCEDGSTPEGCGVVFQLSPPTKKGGAWSETVLYSFTGGSDGGSPVGLVLGKDGKTLFGTTFGYQPNDEGGGVLFQLSPPAVAGGAWTESVLHYFVYGLVSATNTDGGDPESSPIIGPDGTIYGTTLEGGPSIAACPTDRGGCGTVWQLKPPYGPSDYSLVYGFQGGTDGSDDPRSVAITKTGTLVGVNRNGGALGGGYFYQLTPPASGALAGTPWTETVEESYSPTGGAAFGASGGDSIGTPPLVLGNGRIIDTSATGGVTGDGLSYAGAVYEVMPKKKGPWASTLFVPFNGNNGIQPSGAIVLGSADVYLTTLGDGQTVAGPYSGCGTVDAVGLPAGGGRALYVFQCGMDGAEPSGLVKGAKQTLLGVTRGGGANGAGTIFQLSNLSG